MYLKLKTETVNSNSGRLKHNSAIIMIDLTTIMQINQKIYKFQTLPPELEIKNFALQHVDGDLVYEVQNMSHGDVKWNDNCVVLIRQTFHQPNTPPPKKKTAIAKTKSVISSTHGGEQTHSPLSSAHVTQPTIFIVRLIHVLTS